MEDIPYWVEKLNSAKRKTVSTEEMNKNMLEMRKKFKLSSP